jgi:F0F1-type ATP synthase delta subunit
MKYQAHLYAKALDEALADPKANQAVIAKNFLELVRRNGDEIHLRKILEEAARFARGRTGIRKVVIESARPLEKSQENMIQQFVKPGDVVTYSTDPDLVAGIKIILNDEMQFDGTMKGKLDKLFGAGI